jgi:HEPN domain-containing protein
MGSEPGRPRGHIPPERLDFDSTNIPASITKALEEAISCHANECFIAAAIMVRKTLEELCCVRAATGHNLKERIRNLGASILLPKELLEGLDDLRLLGNDAAHIESQEFNTVGKEEVEIGIEFAKEVLKAVYQYSDLLAKLRALKRNPSSKAGWAQIYLLLPLRKTSNRANFQIPPCLEARILRISSMRAASNFSRPSCVGL